MASDHEKRRREGARSSGWGGMLLGLGLLWLLIGVVLPWGQELPGVRPIMAAIKSADIDAGTYWYSQSETTAVAQNYVRNALDHLGGPGPFRKK